jgi:hypothetical protein
VGEPLLQAFQAEHHAVSGQIIVSKDAWSLINSEFTGEQTFDDGYVRLDLTAATKSHVKKKNMSSLMHAGDMEDTAIEAKIKQYVRGEASAGKSAQESSAAEAGYVRGWGGHARAKRVRRNSSAAEAGCVARGLHTRSVAHALGCTRARLHTRSFAQPSPLPPH